jgi:hypothetical protein
MTKRRYPRLSARLLSLSMACIGLSAGCVSELDDLERGTETGNPPVAQPKLDEARVKLVVTTVGVRIEGEKDAATPGAQVEITSALTGQVFRGPVAADGSFGVDVSGSKLDTYAVTVVADGKTSTNTVYVAPGAAAVESSTNGGALSCGQRTELARTQLDALVESISANDPYATRCRIDTDCAEVSSGSSCNDSCSVYALSNAGVQQIETAKQTIKDGLCKDFDTDGCKYTVFPCPRPPGEVACVGHVKCGLVQRSGPDCFDRPVCVNGKKQIWPGVCADSIGEELTGRSQNVVCVATDKGEVGLMNLRDDLTVTNKDWSTSAYGLFPDSLSPNATTACNQQLAALGGAPLQALNDCLNKVP